MQLPGGNFPKWELFGGVIVRGAIVWGAIACGPIVQGGRDNCPRWELCEWQFSRIFLET